VPGHGTWKAVEICRPAAAGLELVVGFVERSIAAGASVDALVGIMLVVFAGEWGFSALLSEDAKLFYIVLVIIILEMGKMETYLC
jgi:hypothetical protein